MTRVAHRAIVLTVLCAVCGVNPALAQEVKVLSAKKQAAFLAERTSGDVSGTFSAYTSMLYALRIGVLHTDSERVSQTQLQSVFPAFYKPTRAEVFNDIAWQTGSTWRYDPETGYWLFSEPRQPVPFTLQMPPDWDTEDHGHFFTYGPANLPPALFIFLAGTYSADNAEHEAAFFQKVRAEVALELARILNEDVTIDDMTPAIIGELDALYYTLDAAQHGFVWRQWVIVDRGMAYIINSRIKPEHEDQLLPDVDAMVESFKIVPPNDDEQEDEPAEQGD